MYNTIAFVAMVMFLVRSCINFEFIQNKPEFSKVSVIQKLYFNMYPGTDSLLNALSERPDTTTFYESEKISYCISTASFNDQDGKVRYDLRDIYYFDKVKHRLFVIPNGSELAIPQRNGDSLWQKLIARAPLNTSKMDDIIEEVFQKDLNKLSIIFKNDFSEESENLPLDSLNIYFDPDIHDDRFSISRHYDTLGYGKAILVEFKVPTFYSKFLNRQVDAFDFYDKIIFHGKVKNQIEIDFLKSINSKVEKYLLNTKK